MHYECEVLLCNFLRKILYNNQLEILLYFKDNCYKI